MQRAALVISIVGPSGVGKTTLVETLLPLLRARGRRVASVKHASHGFEADREGSDSWRHQRAGAEAVLLAGPMGAALFLNPVDTASPVGEIRPTPHHSPTPWTDDAHICTLIDLYLRTYDIVLTEGFVAVSDIVIVLRRVGVPPKVVPAEPRPWLTVTDVIAGDDEITFDALADLADRIGHLADAR